MAVRVSTPGSKKRAKKSQIINLQDFLGGFSARFRLFQGTVTSCLLSQLMSLGYAGLTG